MLLADLGADVIKIEPIEGDLSRQVGSRFVGEHNVYFASINRNKRSVHIDLTTAEGQAELGELAETADALLVNLRPSTIRKLGLDYESLRRFNPKIVCVALTGYGLEGPAAEWPAFDYVIQAGSASPALTGEPDGPPTLAGYSAVDNSSGDHGGARRCSRRCIEGKGGQVDVSLFDVMLSQLNYKAAAYLNGGEIPGAPAARRAQVLRAGPAVRDRLGLPRAVRDPRRVLAAAVRRDRSAANGPTTRGSRRCTPRFDNRAELLDALGARLKEAPAAEWAERLRPLGIAVGAVADLGDALDGELVRARGMVVSVDTDDGPLRVVGESDPVRRRAVRSTARRRACTSTPDELARAARRRAGSGVVVDDDLGARRERLAREDPAVVDLVGADNALLTRIVTDPVSRCAMHVAQLPASHENGGLKPARRAASRIVSPAWYGTVCLRRSSLITSDSVLLACSHRGFGRPRGRRTAR